MMQISRTNTFFSALLSDGRQRAQSAFWKQWCLGAAKHDSAAMPTRSQSNPSSICLSFSGFGKNAFHLATDKQNSRWASLSHILTQRSCSRLKTGAENVSHCLFALAPVSAVDQCRGSVQRTRHARLFIWITEQWHRGKCPASTALLALFCLYIYLFALTENNMSKGGNIVN